MKVYIYPADLQGCGYVRLIWHANVLKRAGHNVVVVPPRGAMGIDGEVYLNPLDENDPRNHTLVSLRVPDDADVMVFQRVLAKYVADAIPHIRRSGRAVVVDMDDDLTTVDPSNPAFLAMHPKYARDPMQHWGHAMNACLNATLVTVSTPKLLKVYAPHGRGRVIENCVPYGFTELDHPDSDVIGWGGSLHSHPKDMLPLGSAIAQLTRSGADFAVVGPGNGVKQALGLDREPLATGPVLIETWPTALAQNIGVGIAPLADTEFNASKSWLKPLEMSALGIPWIASPRAEYRRFQQMHPDAGKLAERPKDWLRLLRKLVDDELMREEMGEAGRQAVREAHTVEANAWRLLEAWSDALTAQRTNMAASRTANLFGAQ